MIWYIICDIWYGMIYDMMWYDMIWYDIWYDMIYNMIYLFNCSWVDTRWQQYSTHLHKNGTQNNTIKQNIQNRTYIKISVHKHNNKIHKHNTKNKYINIRIHKVTIKIHKWQQYTAAHTTYSHICNDTNRTKQFAGCSQSTAGVSKWRGHYTASLTDVQLLVR